MVQETGGWTNLSAGEFTRTLNIFRAVYFSNIYYNSKWSSEKHMISVRDECPARYDHNHDKFNNNGGDEHNIRRYLYEGSGNFYDF